MDRRLFLRSAAAGAALVALPVPAARAAGPWAMLFRSWVPEIFAPLPDPPAHSAAIVVGSGFGGAVAALRLAEAGVQTTVLERGSRWPNDPWREIFTGDDLPDGRGFWHRSTFTGVNQVTMHVEKFGGVLDCTDYPGISVWRAAAVGGGSVIFTGAMVAPQRAHFDRVFRGVVGYDELAPSYDRVRSMLRLSPMPADIYNSVPFTHSRAWDEQVRRAGYAPQPVDSIFDWNVLRDELAGRARPSATAARSNLGNSNGAKYDLNRNYLRLAEQTGRAAIFPGHRIDAIGTAGDRFRVETVKLAPTGEVLTRRTLTCDRLVLAAGSVGTSELLVRARATGALPRLNEHVGQGWGTNGDVALARGASAPISGSGGVPCASMITVGDTTLQNWFIPGVPFETGALASLGMVLDPTRGQFAYDKASDTVGLAWPARGNRAALDAAGRLNDEIADRAGSMVRYDAIGYAANATFTAHPLGGAVLGAATDSFGRVHGHPGLYVLDGAAIPGSTGAVNPSLTIAALAERNIAEIIRSKR